jgi:hypothetical protein
LESQVSRFFGCESEYEIRGEAFPVAIDRFVEIASRYPVKSRQIGIDQHFLAAREIDRPRDVLNRDDLFAHFKSSQANRRAI